MFDLYLALFITLLFIIIIIINIYYYHFNVHHQSAVPCIRFKKQYLKILFKVLLKILLY